MDMTTLERLSFEASDELLNAAHTEPGDIFVVGCSTSEITGRRIGSAPSPDIAEAVLSGLLRAVETHSLVLAVQCCEHLNRALVVPLTHAPRRLRLNAQPQPHAGGSLAAAYYRHLSPSGAAVVSSVSACAGIDIGQTLIGMHLMPVAVPVRLSIRLLGEAVITAARSRPPFTGGERAVYDSSLL